MNTERCKFTFREEWEPDAYVIYADDVNSYVLCDRCVFEPRSREFPVYADEVDEIMHCDKCGRVLDGRWP